VKSSESKISQRHFWKKRIVGQRARRYTTAATQRKFKAVVEVKPKYHPGNGKKREERGWSEYAKRPHLHVKEEKRHQRE